MILKLVANIRVASFFVTAGLYGLSAGEGVSETRVGHCQAPDPICLAKTSIFRIASFDPIGSAVMIGPGLLITNRHLVADRTHASVYVRNGRIVRASVVPTSYSGDLVLLKLNGLDTFKAVDIGAATQNSKLYTIGVEIRTKQVRVYPPGGVIFLPAEDKPLARLHHSAPSQPGNSGGGLVDMSGRLVGIVTSGGDGFNEAIPATEIDTLRLLSGQQYKQESRKIGIAYRQCIKALQIRGSGNSQIPTKANFIADCTNSQNRQLFDLAGQALGRAGEVDHAITMFQLALTQDPHAINSRIGLIVTLHLGHQFGASLPHLQKLIKLFPSNLQILRLSIQAGKRSRNLTLGREALKLLEQHYPRLAPNFKRFLEDVPQK